MIVNNICTMLSQERYRSVFNIFSHETAYISVEVRTKVEDKLLYWYSQMNFLIDAESKLPSSNDPNPKGGNDPEKARESPPGRIRLFAAPTLFFSLLSFFLFFFSFFFLFSLFFFPLFSFFFLFCFRLQMATRSLNFDSCMCAHGRWKPGRCPCEAGYQPRPVNEARATFSIPSSVLGFYLRYVCLSVYSGPYANYTKGLSHPPSAFPENTHVHARNEHVSRVSTRCAITLRGLFNGKKIHEKIDFSADWRLE